MNRKTVAAVSTSLLLGIFAACGGVGRRPAPSPTVPERAWNLDVRCLTLKLIDGRHRYFFVIKNDDTDPFTGEIRVNFLRDRGRKVPGDTFTFDGNPLQPGDSRQGYIDMKPGRQITDGEWEGFRGFEYTVNGHVKTGDVPNEITR